MSPRSLEGQTNRGSYFGKDYEFRITERCLTEDLGASPDTSFAEVQDKPMPKALIRDRRTTPAGGKTVGPAAGDKTLYRLSHGERDRGVSWWDENNRVVWLCAAHNNHRSGAEDDSFRYFEQLIAAKRIRPNDDDYNRLFDERDEWFNNFALQDAQELLGEARQNQGAEVRGVVGRAIPTGVVVEVVDTAEETFVVFRWMEIEDLQTLETLLAAFYPESKWTDWDDGRSFPYRDLAPGEKAWCYFKDSA